MEERAEAHAERFETVEDNTDNEFVRFLKDEVFIQSELREPLTEENVVLISRYFGYAIHQMQQMMAGMDNAKYMNDPTGNKQRDVILAILYQSDVRLLEEAIQEIERTEDVELLNIFACLSSCLFVEMFRKSAHILFGEAFEKACPALWHLFNKPIWWNTFREHRNDGLSDSNLET